MANMYHISGLTLTARENPEWFTRATFSGRLISGGYIRFLTGIKGDEIINKLTLENKVLQIDGLDCGWTPNKIFKISEKKASVKTYKINLEQCLNELEQTRLKYQFSPGANNESLPSDLEESTMMLLAIQIADEIEQMVINGNEAENPNEFDGLYTQLINSTEAIKIHGQEITSANALAAFRQVYNAIPLEVLQTRARNGSRIYIMGSYGTERALLDALDEKSNQTLTESWSVTGGPDEPRIYYRGIEFVPVVGLDNTTLIAYENANAMILTDLESDLEDIRMGSFPAPNDDKIWVKGRMRLGFGIPFEEEMVIYSAAIAEGDQTTGRPADGGLTVVPINLVFAAAGETKVFNIFTKEGVTPTIEGNATGFTATAGETSTVEGRNVTPVTVVATSNVGNLCPRVGEVIVTIPDEERIPVTVMLDQRMEDVEIINP